MSDLMLTREEARDVDRKAIEVYGLPGIILMENAGRGVAELLIRVGANGPVIVCAGAGNNGGDGFVVARHLENLGIKVQVFLFCDPAELHGDAAINFRVLVAAGTPLIVLTAPWNLRQFERGLEHCYWIVDALLGTGARGDVREPFRSVIDLINRAAASKLAVDVPSGLDCDTGRPLGNCVRADHTATFVARKQGFEAPGATDWTGCVHVVDIGIPRRLLSDLKSRKQHGPSGDGNATITP